MAEKSSFMGEKIEFHGKNRVFSFLVISSFPQNAQTKKPEMVPLAFRCPEID